MSTMRVPTCKHPFTAEEQALMENALNLRFQPNILSHAESCGSIEKRFAGTCDFSHATVPQSPDTFSEAR